MKNEIVLTKEEQEQFRQWLIDKGYTKNITIDEMNSEYHKFVAYNVLFA